MTTRNMHMLFAAILVVLLALMIPSRMLGQQQPTHQAQIDKDNLTIQQLQQALDALEKNHPDITSQSALTVELFFSEVVKTLGGAFVDGLGNLAKSDLAKLLDRKDAEKVVAIAKFYDLAQSLADMKVSSAASIGDSLAEAGGFDRTEKWLKALSDGAAAFEKARDEEKEKPDIKNFVAAAGSLMKFTGDAAEAFSKSHKDWMGRLNKAGDVTSVIGDLSKSIQNLKGRHEQDLKFTQEAKPVIDTLKQQLAGKIAEVKRLQSPAAPYRATDDLPKVAVKSPPRPPAPSNSADPKPPPPLFPNPPLCPPGNPSCGGGSGAAIGRGGRGGGGGPVALARPPSPSPSVGPLALGGSDVGGVLLKLPANVTGANPESSTLGSSQFSFNLQDPSAGIDFRELRRFVTAMWAVYFSKDGPGISIDPIAPGAEQQFVRYVGKVRQSDLGRVMRVADYTMKKWAVGVEHPLIPNFQSVDSLTRDKGVRYFGASRRFVFMPENMQFRQVGDALVFESGKMTVKTGYVVQDKGVPAEPADQAFARAFTDRYSEIEARYPIYQELFDYAKLVSLAQYIKDQRTPLLWFVMANKDLALTEDTPPETVKALIKKSETFQSATVEGGVDFTKHACQYYFPAAAAPSATSWALETRRSTEFVISRGMAGGSSYQTDIALRHGNEPGLELVRKYDPASGPSGFGPGWQVLQPYRVKPASDIKIPFAGGRAPESMRVENLITGKAEVLSFNRTRYETEAYVPDNAEASTLLFMSRTTDGTVRLVDKLGNEFLFDEQGRIRQVVITDDYKLDYIYDTEKAGDVTVPVLRGLRQGGERIVFDYEYHGGQFRVRQATVMKEGLSTSLYSIRYNYAPDGRLASIAGPDGNVSEIHYTGATTSISGGTPLRITEADNDKDVAEMLRQCVAASIDTIDDAAKEGDLERVKALLNQDPSLVSSRDDHGNSPLHWAAFGGHEDIAELLLAKGADVNARDDNGVTPLHNAAGTGRTAIAALLLAHQALVNARSNVGATPLHNAAGNGHLSVAELLLAHGGDVNAKGDGDLTPLHNAAFAGAKDVAALLLAHKADINARSAKGNTPLGIAKQEGQTSIEELLRQHGGRE